MQIFLLDKANNRTSTIKTKLKMRLKWIRMQEKLMKTNQSKSDRMTVHVNVSPIHKPCVCLISVLPPEPQQIVLNSGFFQTVDIVYR